MMHLIRTLVIVLFAIVTISLLSSSDDSWADVPVEGIAFDNSGYDYIKDYNLHDSLPYIITPDNASNKSVTWISSDTSLLKIYSDGSFRLYDYGTVTVTVCTDDGGFTDTCLVKVGAGIISFYCGDEYIETRVIGEDESICMPSYDNTVGWREKNQYYEGDDDEYKYDSNVLIVGQNVKLSGEKKLYALQPVNGYCSIPLLNNVGIDEKLPLIKQLIDDGYNIEVRQTSRLDVEDAKKYLEYGIPICVSKGECYRLILMDCPDEGDINVGWKSSSSSMKGDKYSGFQHANENYSTRTYKVKFIGDPDKMVEGTWILESNGVRTETVEEDGHQTAVIYVSSNGFRGAAKSTGDSANIFIGVTVLGAALMFLVMIGNRSFRRTYVPNDDGEERR